MRSRNSSNPGQSETHDASAQERANYPRYFQGSKDSEYDEAPSRAQEQDRRASGYEVPGATSQGRSATYGTYGDLDSFDRNVSGSRYSATNTDGAGYGELEKYSDYAHYREDDRARNASNIQGEFAGKASEGEALDLEEEQH